MTSIKDLLIRRLAGQGMAPSIIPGFIRSLARSVVVYPHMNLLQINRKLHYLGWQGHELDYHTYQLALACLEDEGDACYENLSDVVMAPYFHSA